MIWEHSNGHFSISIFQEKDTEDSEEISRLTNLIYKELPSKGYIFFVYIFTEMVCGAIILFVTFYGSHFFGIKLEMIDNPMYMYFNLVSQVRKKLPSSGTCKLYTFTNSGNKVDRYIACAVSHYIMYEWYTVACGIYYFIGTTFVITHAFVLIISCICPCLRQ